MKPTEFIELNAYEGRTTSELSADYILPDTFPDVKKILRTTAKPVLIGRYISPNKLEFSGAVDYSVIFSADTDECESIHCVHFAGDWDGAIANIDNLDGANITVTPHVTSCNVRLANPRKLTLKSTVTTDVKISSPCHVSPSIDGAATKAEEMALERLSKTVTSRRERTFVADPLRISENLEPDASQPSIDEIISCNAAVCFNDAKVNRDNDFTVSLKGMAVIDCIYKSQGEAGVYKSFSRKVPVSYIVGAEEYENYFAACRPETLAAYASATTVEVNASVGENSYGERRVIELDMSADVTVNIVGGEDVGIVLDAYSVVRDSECVMREYDTETPGKMLFANFSVGQSVSRGELSIPEGASLVDAAIEATVTEMKPQRGRLQLTGNAAVSCIIEDGGSFSSVEAVLPIKCELNAGEISEPISYVCELQPSDLRARLDPDSLFFDFEVSLCAKVCEKQRRSAVSSVRLSGEERESERGATLTLCYPMSGDTLWDVAKRYKTTVAALEAANSAAASVLLIPKASEGIIV